MDCLRNSYVIKLRADVDALLERVVELNLHKEHPTQNDIKTVALSIGIDGDDAYKNTVVSYALHFIQTNYYFPDRITGQLVYDEDAREKWSRRERERC